LGEGHGGNPNSHRLGGLNKFHSKFFLELLASFGMIKFLVSLLILSQSAVQVSRVSGCPSIALAAVARAAVARAAVARAAGYKSAGRKFEFYHLVSHKMLV
jgi:hypothetical protein